MKLKSVKVTEFQSIRETEAVEITDITCLVGKNEAGKTAFLKALYRLNPIIQTEGKYDVTDDYPRADVEEYQQKVDSEEQRHVKVVTAIFELDAEVESIEKEFGIGVIITPQLELSKGYDNQKTFRIYIDENIAVQSLATTAQLPSLVHDALLNCSTLSDISEKIEDLRDDNTEEHINRLVSLISKVENGGGLDQYIYDNYLSSTLPKFLYFDQYYLMRGGANIEALEQRRSSNTLEPSDHPLLGLLELAGIDLTDLKGFTRTQTLVNKLEGTGNRLSKKVLRYWSQNKHVSLRFDVRRGLPNDPERMQTGTNLWINIYDSKRMVTTTLDSRSRGFVWFFSFLAWFDKQQKNRQPLILLLDEPGLFLHGRAQSDLLKYMEQELKDSYQVIYTTHSPFMVDPTRFDRVRIVQDRSVEISEVLPPEEDGTKIITDVLEATEDSLFPLQGALGYDIHQTLFVGPNNLVVEGVSDLLYIQSMSAVLSSLGRQTLSDEWTITPVGGSEKVPTFVALLGAQKGLKIATLIDIQKKDKQTVENLYKRKLLKKQNVLTFADFTGTTEADIEDMFGDDFYLELVNSEFESYLSKPIKPSMLKSRSPRILVRIEQYLAENPLTGDVKFSHYRPARYFIDNIAHLIASVPNEVIDRFEKAFQDLNKLL